MSPFFFSLTSVTCQFASAQSNVGLLSGKVLWIRLKSIYINGWPLQATFVMLSMGIWFGWHGDGFFLGTHNRRSPLDAEPRQTKWAKRRRQSVSWSRSIYLSFCFRIDWQNSVSGTMSELIVFQRVHQLARWREQQQQKNELECLARPHPVIRLRKNEELVASHVHRFRLMFLVRAFNVAFLLLFCSFSISDCSYKAFQCWIELWRSTLFVFLFGFFLLLSRGRDDRRANWSAQTWVMHSQLCTRVCVSVCLCGKAVKYRFLFELQRRHSPPTSTDACTNLNDPGPLLCRYQSCVLSTCRWLAKRNVIVLFICFLFLDRKIWKTLRL